MKRFGLILLSLGLVMAFSVSAFAVDVKVGAEYYAAGMYLNKTSLYDGPLTIPAYKWEKAKVGGKDPHPARWKREDPKNGKKDLHVNEAGSTAFFFQRLRVGTDFIVSPGLKLVTRFDAMERIWGGQRSPVGTTLDPMSAGTRAESENIAFDLGYIDYTSPVGQFRVGYQKESTWGTIFGNNGESTPTGQIRYDRAFGAFSVVAMFAKMNEKSFSAVNTSTSLTDQDYDSYRVGGIYNFKNDKVNGQAGVLLIYGRDATYKDDSSSAYLTRAYTVNPYFKAAIGPVALQGEAFYTFGDSKDYEGVAPSSADKKLDAWRAFLDANANFGMFNVGGSVAWLSGDDPSTSDRIESYSSAGLDWNPCLIMFSNDVSYWVGNVYGNIYPSTYTSTKLNGPMANAWFFQGRVGVTPTPQLNVALSVSYAMADKKPAGFSNGTYGTEVDLTGSYKITNNLTYVLGAGYLFTGDYFKGTGSAWTITGHETPPVGAAPPADAPTVEVQDNFMIMNKLILNF